MKYLQLLISFFWSFSKLDAINHPCGSILQSEFLKNATESRNLIVPCNNVWPDGKVHYDILDEFNKSEKELIELAMLHIERQTCIQFIKRINESSFVTFLKTVRGCSSAVGYVKNSVRLVELNPEYCLTLGSLVHELLHILGFGHEHQRSDRKNYIEVHWEKISSKNFYCQYYRFKSKNEICPDCSASTLIKDLDKCCIKSFIGDNNKLPYDYGSIMHYSIDAGGPKSMSPKKKVPPGIKLGSRQSLSIFDVEKINQVYSCKVPTDTCQGENKMCVFPFKYEGKTYRMCTSVKEYRPWCATKVYKNSGQMVLGHWNFCRPSCFRCGISNNVDELCGRTERGYGRKTTIYESAWYAFLINPYNSDKSINCGGAIIDAQFIITSASCYGSTEWSKVVVKLSATDAKEPQFNAQYFTIKEIHFHPKYNSENYTYDVALVKLHTPMYYSDRAIPVCLPYDEVVFSRDTLATFSGVHVKGSSGTTLSLSVVRLTSNDDDRCQQINEYSMCTDNQYFQCDKDVGGPLVMKVNGRCTLIGIASKRSKCRQGLNIIVYTKIKSVLSWVQSITDK